MPPTLPDKKPKPPRENWNYGYLCHRCHDPLAGVYAVKINDPSDPNDDEALCLDCAKLQTIQPETASYEGRAFIFGLSVSAIIAAFIAWLT